MNSSNIGILLSAVIGLNIILSAIQKVFTELGKKEPGPLTTFSKIISQIAQWASANPTLNTENPTVSEEKKP